MARLAEAAVGVAVVHGDQVYVAEDKAVVVVVLKRLRVADVQQLRTVEDLVSVLNGQGRGSEGNETTGQPTRPFCWGGGALECPAAQVVEVRGLVRTTEQKTQRRSRRRRGRGGRNRYYQCN